MPKEEKRHFIRKIPGFRSGKKWKMVLASVVYLIVILGIISGFTSKDCGSDGNCFEKALKDCSGAKASIPLATGQYDFEIMGKTGTSCNIHWTAYTAAMIIERDCTMPIGTTLNGTTSLAKAARISSYLQNCGNEKRS